MDSSVSLIFDPFIQGLSRTVSILLFTTILGVPWATLVVQISSARCLFLATMLTSRAFSLSLLIIIHAPYISARGGRFGGGGKIHFALNLGSVDAATFAFYIIFSILTFLQALQALGALGKRRSGEDFPRRVPFILLAFFGILSQLGTYSLSAVIESQTNEVTLSLNFVLLTTMLSFIRALTHVFLYAALLLLLDYRSTIQALQYQHSRSKNFVITLRAASVIPLLLMFVCTVARIIIGTTQTMTYFPNEQPPLSVQSYNALYHLFVASYIIATAVICGGSIILWKNKLDSQHDWMLFDTDVLARIVRIICPLIAIHAVFELTVDIISSVPQFYLGIDDPVFTLVDILIRGTTYFMVISVMLGLGFPPSRNMVWRNK